ncbi:MAG TPA: M24 family metallopeptidase [Pyrinomonadaceae bacterium]|jgi:antitoxin VapB|nr:M24 family metallopeptidase [Pyrinomonadaceae bacterium]
MSAELDEKTDRLVAIIATSGLGGILINSQPNFAWLTCGGSNGIDHSRDPGAASILVRKDGRRFILANNIELPRLLAEEVSTDLFEPVEFQWQREKAELGLVGTLAASICDGTVGLESEFDAKIAKCRYTLTDTEVERYRLLGRDAGAAMDRVANKITPDIAEFEIAEVMRAELAVARIDSVVTLVAADERIGWFRHPVPTAKRLERTVLLVTCARRGGLTASLSRMVSVGVPDDNLQQKTEAAAYVNAKLLNATREGTTGTKLYDVAATAYAERGYAGEIERHHQGGATGYRTRDWVAHSSSDELVQPRQAFAWNPSITGTKVEDTVVVDGDRVEVLTPSPGFPSITDVINGREFTATGILTI